MTWLHRVESAAAFAAWTQSLESWRFHFSPCFHCSEISAEMIKHDLSMQMVSHFISTNSTCHTDPQMQMLACFRTPCLEDGMAQWRLGRRRLMIRGGKPVCSSGKRGSFNSAVLSLWLLEWCRSTAVQSHVAACTRRVYTNGKYTGSWALTQSICCAWMQRGVRNSEYLFFKKLQETNSLLNIFST